MDMQVPLIPWAYFLQAAVPWTKIVPWRLCKYFVCHGSFPLVYIEWPLFVGLGYFLSYRTGFFVF